MAAPITAVGLTHASTAAEPLRRDIIYDRSSTTTIIIIT